MIFLKKFPWKDKKIININTPQILNTMLFEAAMIVIIGAMSKKSVKPFTPAHNIIGNTGAKIITAVPRSGWFKTKKDDNKAIKIGMITI